MGLSRVLVALDPPEPLDEPLDDSPEDFSCDFSGDFVELSLELLEESELDDDESELPDDDEFSCDLARERDLDESLLSVL